MKISRCFSALLAASLTLYATVPTFAAGPAVDRLKYFDGTTSTAWFDGQAKLYAAPVKGNYGTPQRYRAQLLFARPDRFRLMLRPGAKNEYRAVGNAGSVQWLDLGTGFSGQGKALDYVDPAALDLLRAVGELWRFAPSKELPAADKGNLRGAVLVPKSFDSRVKRAVVWFRNDQPYSFDFEFVDGRKLQFTVSSFKQNVPTKPSDFQL